MVEAEVANAELVGLLRHSCGCGDPEVMVAFDKVARSKLAGRDVAIAGVRAMLATTNGRIVVW